MLCDPAICTLVLSLFSNLSGSVLVGSLMLGNSEVSPILFNVVQSINQFQNTLPSTHLQLQVYHRSLHSIPSCHSKHSITLFTQTVTDFNARKPYKQQILSYCKSVSIFNNTTRTQSHLEEHPLYTNVL